MKIELLYGSDLNVQRFDASFSEVRSELSPNNSRRWCPSILEDVFPVKRRNAALAWIIICGDVARTISLSEKEIGNFVSLFVEQKLPNKELA